MLLHYRCILATIELNRCVFAILGLVMLGIRGCVIAMLGRSCVARMFAGCSDVRMLLGRSRVNSEVHEVHESLA